MPLDNVKEGSRKGLVTALAPTTVGNPVAMALIKKADLNRQVKSGGCGSLGRSKQWKQ